MAIDGEGLVPEALEEGVPARDPVPPLLHAEPAQPTGVVLPGLLVGFIAAPEACLELLHQSQSALTWMAPALTAELAAHVIRDGTLARIVEAKRAEVRKRRALYQRRLGHLPTPSHPDSPCVWAALPEPWRGEELVAAAERQGVLISAAETFAVSRAHTPHAVRLCGTPERRADLDTALQRIAKILEGVPAPCRALV